MPNWQLAVMPYYKIHTKVYKEWHHICLTILDLCRYFESLLLIVIILKLITVNYIGAISTLILEREIKDIFTQYNRKLPKSYKYKKEKKRVKIMIDLHRLIVPLIQFPYSKVFTSKSHRWCWFISSFKCPILLKV